MKIETYEDIPRVARSIFDEIWKQNESVFETMDRKEVAEEIFGFLIDDLSWKIEEWLEG